LSISLFLAEKQPCKVGRKDTPAPMEHLHTSISQPLLRVGRRVRNQNVAKNVLFPEKLAAKGLNKKCIRCGTTKTATPCSSTPLRGQWPQ